MSSEIAIKVDGISKCFQIYERPHDRLKQSIYSRLQKIFGKKVTHYFREFWALKNVSLEIRKGQTVGIIGRNGSGKSTLLQIICGTLSPTSGIVETHGRIAALLELGSGFNLDFTGRENVYMNAAILGLTTAEIEHRFNDIVAFADIGDFIEQPVKTYSSGMMLRLAFAVIAHVDADILVIDEALAVGDTVFTQKCMRFLRKFMESGTLLFVSHDSAAVINLCESALWLHKGEMKLHGSAKIVTEAYLESTLQDLYGADIQLESLEAVEVDNIDTTFGIEAIEEAETRIHLFDALASSAGWKTGGAEIESVRFLDASGKPLNFLCGGELVCLAIRASAKTELYSPILGFFVKDRLGQSLFGEHTFTYVSTPGAIAAGQHVQATFKFRMPLLQNGDYAITASIAEGTPDNHVQHHWVHDAIVFKVASKKQRYGLTGIPFESVSMEVVS
jgi:lipopolysaccharide transport system ATP-binding protein